MNVSRKATSGRQRLILRRAICFLPGNVNLLPVSWVVKDLPPRSAQKRTASTFCEARPLTSLTCELGRVAAASTEVQALPGFACASDVIKYPLARASLSLCERALMRDRATQVERIFFRPLRFFNPLMKRIFDYPSNALEIALKRPCERKATASCLDQQEGQSFRCPSSRSERAFWGPARDDFAGDFLEGEGEIL